MKAAFALLADEPTHNTVRGLAWQMFQQHGISLETSRLPCHVSLKQPFDIPNAEMLEGYMAELASSLFPIDIILTEMELIKVAEEEQASGILWLHAEWSPELWGLHDRINKELEARFGSTQADFDGPDYQFHMTIAMGRPFATYERAYQEFKGALAEIQFQARSMALFVYDNKDGLGTEYISYKFLPLGRGKQEPIL